MPASKPIKWIVIIGLVLAATIMSSWLGALLWVSSFPGIIVYEGAPQILDTSGKPISTAKQGQWVIFRANVQRQPLRCWGEFIYVLKGETTNYQFPMIRSYGLTMKVENYVAKNLFEIPAGIPPGHYDWDVVIYPHCDTVEMSPTTYSLGASTEITAK